MAKLFDPWIPRIDPGHPAAAGPIAFRLTVDNDRIAALEPRIDLVHRGAEKLFESRDLRQCLTLSNRHDWLSAFNSELGLALLLESTLGIEPPDRAQWLRTLLSEVARIVHSLHWLTETLTDESVPDRPLPAVAGGRRARELLVDALTSVTGNPLYPMLNQPGGLRSDVTDEWLGRVAGSIPVIASAITELADWLRSPAGCRFLPGVAVLPTAMAGDLGATGPVARASGVPADLRIDRPYCRYPELLATGVLHRPNREAATGDARDRLVQLTLEAGISLRCIAACLDSLTGSTGPVSVRLPRTWRIPAGEFHHSTEGPTGVNGWLLVSDGGPRPRRLKIASASFANARALCTAVIGAPVDQLRPMILTSLLIAGDLGR